VKLSEQGGEPERRPGQILKSQVLGRRRVTLIVRRWSSLMIDALLEQIECQLANTRPDYLARLLPGVSDAALDVFEVRFSLKLPGDFRKAQRGQVSIL